MNITILQEAHRMAAAELVADLGYDPANVLQDIELTRSAVRIKVVERDKDGKVKVDGLGVVTHVERKRITVEQFARYQATVRRESEGA